MRKIPTLFVRDQQTKLVTPTVNPECQWVLDGQGVGTRKLDGTCCRVQDGKLFKRHEVKHRGNAKEGWQPFLNYPAGWEAAAPLDPETGKEQGLVPVGDGPEDRWHREAWAAWQESQKYADECYVGGDGTYELCGPKVQGNPERFDSHVLMEHDTADRLPDAPRDFAGLREYLRTHDVEGIVWHRDNGDMVKIKKRDFGIKRG